jgi:two-component system response regulator FixJ
LILDLRMPGMDGLELQQRLASDGHRTPIVMLTAHGDDEVRSPALGAGAAVFLAKPSNGEVLLAAVKAALGKR